jgi:hypothetical protein
MVTITRGKRGLAHDVMFTVYFNNILGYIQKFLWNLLFQPIFIFYTFYLIADNLMDEQAFVNGLAYNTLKKVLFILSILN